MKRDRPVRLVTSRLKCERDTRELLRDATKWSKDNHGCNAVVIVAGRGGVVFTGCADREQAFAVIGMLEVAKSRICKRLRDNTEVLQ